MTAPRQSLIARLRADPKYKECFRYCKHELLCLECYLKGEDVPALQCKEHGWVDERGHSRHCRAFWMGLCEKHFKEHFGTEARFKYLIRLHARTQKSKHNWKHYLRTLSEFQLEWSTAGELGLVVDEAWIQKSNFVSLQMFRHEITRQAARLGIALPERLTDQQLQQLMEQTFEQINNNLLTDESLAEIIRSALDNK